MSLMADENTPQTAQKKNVYFPNIEYGNNNKKYFKKQ